MYVSFFLIVINIILLFIFSLNKKAENNYIREKIKFNKYRLNLFIKYINIGYIITYLLYYLIIMLNIGITNIKFYYLHLILFLVNIIIFILINNFTKIKSKRFKLIEKKPINDTIFLIIMTFYNLFVIEKVIVEYEIVGENAINKYDFINNMNIIIKFISLVLLGINLFIIIKKILKNKDKCLYAYNKEHYLEDIKFYDRVDIKKSLNHFIYITAYIVFFYINIPFIYFFYLIVAILLSYMIYRKYKKIVKESDRLYKNVSLLKNKPGIIYPFQFIRDVFLLRKLFIFLFILVFSTALYYGLGESVFSYTTISMYIVLLNIIIEDKIYLIKYLSSLNDRFIDKKKYNISVNKKINYIDIIEIFKIKLYKLIIADTIIYESNIIIYDPEYRIDELNIRINKSNIEDYITFERELYEEE